MPRGDKPTTTALALKDGWIYEDTLPAEITKEQYDWWFKESLVLDGVRMGPPLTTCPAIAYPVRVEPEPGYEGVACIPDSSDVLVAAMMHPEQECLLCGHNYFLEGFGCCRKVRLDGLLCGCKCKFPAGQPLGQSTPDCGHTQTRRSGRSTSRRCYYCSPCRTVGRWLGNFRTGQG